MGKHKKKKPEIRFKGFTDDWEQRKLGDLGTTFSGLSGKTKKDFGCGDAKFITYMNVYTNAISDIDMTEKVGIDNKQHTVHYGDILFTTSSEIPEEVGMSSVWLGNEENIYLNSFCFGFRPTEILNSYYMAYMLRGDAVRKNIIYLAQGISRYNISKNRVMNIEVPITTIPEQDIIGSYFDKLDHLITLHQRKLEKLKKVKKSMLEKMFPQNGEMEPQIRFCGFNSTWEQRKLGEVVERIIRKNVNMDSILPLTISAQYGLIAQSEFFDKRIASRDLSGYYLLYNGEFAYNKSTSADAPWGAIKRLDRYEKGVLSTLYIVFAIRNLNVIDSNYLVTYYDNDVWYKDVSAIAAEGARNHGLLNIAPDDFFATNIKKPKNLTEQKQIGEYFDKLDHLITLHQRKLEKLKKMKKAMLEKMFV